MPKISDLPTDTAPASTDLIPFVDVDAARTESVTVANLAASAAFSGQYAPLASPTFTGNVVVPTADADTEALNRITADGRFAPIQTDLWLNPDDFYATSAVGSRTEIVEGVPGWNMGDSDTDGQATLAAATLLPAAWATFNVELWWTNLSANSGNVTFQCNTRFLGDGDTVATPAFGVNTTIAAPSQLVLKVSAIRSAVSATSGDVLVLQVARTSLNSTLNGNAAILGVRLVKAS